MRRREFLGVLAGGAVAWPVAARAQLPIHRIGHLAIAAPTDTPPPPPANWHAFVQGLREIGYMEGQNVAFEHRSAHDQPELFPKFALELANLKVEVISARGTWALAAAKNATRTIPIVGIDLEVDLRVKSARLTHLCHCSMSSLLAAFCSIASVSVVTSADAHAARQTAPDAGERS
jgi:hypothetical protein